MHYIHDVCRLGLLQTNPQFFVSLKCKFPLNFKVFTMSCLFWCYNLVTQAHEHSIPKVDQSEYWDVCMDSLCTLLTLLGIVDILDKDGFSSRTRLGRSNWFLWKTMDGEQNIGPCFYSIENCLNFPSMLWMKLLHGCETLNHSEL